MQAFNIILEEFETLLVKRRNPATVNKRPFSLDIVRDKELEAIKVDTEGNEKVRVYGQHRTVRWE